MVGKLKEIPGFKRILKNAVIFSVTSVILLLNNFSDQFFVVQLGRVQASAYTLDVPLFWILISASAALGVVYSTDVKRYLDGNDLESANKAAISACVYSVIFGLVFSLISGVLLVFVFQLVPEREIGDEALTYMLPMLVMFFVITLNSVLGGLLNAEGKFKVYVVALALFLGGNATFDYLFLNMEMGIFGNGLSTVIGAALSLVFELWWYLTGKTTIKLSMERFSWSFDVLKSAVLRIKKFLIRHLTKDVAELCIRFSLYTTYTLSYGIPMMYSTFIATIGMGAGAYLSGEYKRLLSEGDSAEALSLFIRSSLVIVPITFVVAVIFSLSTDLLIEPFVPFDSGSDSKEIMMWTLSILCFTAPFVGLKYLANAVTAPVGRLSYSTTLLIIWAVSKVIAFFYFLGIDYEFAIYVILAERALSSMVSILLTIWYIRRKYPKEKASVPPAAAEASGA